MKIVSGFRPTGLIHLGNYLGVFKQWLELQEQRNICFFFIADLHSLTDNLVSSEEKKRQVEEMMLDFLALGLNPRKAVLFLQSRVEEVTELAWIFNCLAPLGELSRMTQFKEKSQKQKENVNAGLFTYPSLMAADILIFKAQGVPVGEDQLQHLEFTRELARKFNRIFGKIFPEPQALLTKAARLKSLKNPLEKMSKSDPDSYLGVFEEPRVIFEKLKKATTASNEIFKKIRKTKEGFDFEPSSYGLGHPEYEKMKSAVENFLLMLEEFSPEKLEKLFDGEEINLGKLRYSELKNDLAKAIVNYFAPFRLKKEELRKNKKKVYKIFEEGTKKAKSIAQKTLKEVKEKIGLF